MRPEMDRIGEAIALLRRRHGIRRASFFGSALRGDFAPESDVDILVEFEPGRVLRIDRPSEPEKLSPRNALRRGGGERLREIEDAPLQLRRQALKLACDLFAELEIDDGDLPERHYDP